MERSHKWIPQHGCFDASHNAALVVCALLLLRLRTLGFSIIMPDDNPFSPDDAKFHNGLVAKCSNFPSAEWHECQILPHLQTSKAFPTLA